MILAKVGLLDFFHAVADGNDIIRSKPDPEVFLKAAEYLCEAPENCVVVEDAVAGIEAGKCCGMATVAIGDAASAHIADYKIKSLCQFCDIIGRREVSRYRSI